MHAEPDESTSLLAPTPSEEPSPTTSSNTSTKIAVYVLFFGVGWVFGHWAVRVPDIQDNLDVGDGLLGFALLFSAVGVFCGLPTTATLGRDHGTKVATGLGAVLFSFSLILLGGSSTLVMLIFSLWVYGFVGGMYDVSVNAQAVLCETAEGRPMMATFHASYAFGAASGSIVSGIFASQGWSPFDHFLVVGSVSALVFLIAAQFLYDKKDEAILLKTDELPQTSTTSGLGSILTVVSNPRELRTLTILCIIVLVGSMAEGSMSDWTAVYLKHYIGANSFVSSLGFELFELSMMISRLSDVQLRYWFSEVLLLRGGAWLACGGLMLTVIAYSLKVLHPIVATTVAVLGFGLTGVGLAHVNPIVYSTAGHIPNCHPSEALAIISVFTYTGWMAGPPIFGFISDLLGSLRWSLLLDGLIVLIIAGLAGRAGLGTQPTRKTQA